MTGAIVGGATYTTTTVATAARARFRFSAPACLVSGGEGVNLSIWFKIFREISGDNSRLQPERHVGVVRSFLIGQFFARIVRMRVIFLER